MNGAYLENMPLALLIGGIIGFIIFVFLKIREDRRIY